MVRVKKEWIAPSLLLIGGVLLLSVLVTKIRSLRQKTVQENFQSEEDTRSPTQNSDRVRHILKYLQVYLLASHPRRNWLVSDQEGDDKKPLSHRWQDLSNGKNDFTWRQGNDSVDPSGFATKDHTLQGPPASKLNVSRTNQMTIILRAQSQANQSDDDPTDKPVEINEIISNAQGKETTLHIPADQKDRFELIKRCLTNPEQTQSVCSTSLEEMKNLQDALNKLPSHGRKPRPPPIVLRLPGNQQDALVLRLPQNYGPIHLEVGGEKFKTNQSVTAQRDTYYSLVYSDGTLKVYTDKVLLNIFSTPKIYLNDGLIQMNPDGRWNSVLRDVAILNKALTLEQLELFQQKNLVLKAIVEQHQSPLEPGLPLPDDCSSCSGRCVCPGMKPFDPFKKHHKPKHPDQCECKVSCQCDVDPFPDDNPDEYRKCPRVTIDDYGNYIVDGSNLGSNKRRAKEIYQINYPDCQRLPPELRHDYERHHHRKGCPFVVRGDLNPCFSSACNNADWRAENVADANLSGSCRRRVDAYCSEHADLDDFCRCWRPEYQDLPQCRRFVAQFNDPDRRGCNIAEYDLEEHPDADKYIRKDKIPCWGCSLDASGKSTCPGQQSEDCDSGRSLDGPALSLQANVSLRTSEGSS